MKYEQFQNPAPPAPPILVDQREAARLLSISPRKLWDLTFHRGEIPSLKIGRCVRYRVSDLNDWAAKTVQSTDHVAAEMSEA